MRQIRKSKIISSDPMYDDCMLMHIEEQQTEELLSGLVEYCLSLEKQVVDLRIQVNNLTPMGRPKPYFDLHGDLYEVFHQYAAYPKFKHILKPLD